MSGEHLTRVGAVVGASAATRRSVTRWLPTRGEKQMAHLVCDCGNEYEIRDDTPAWAAPWFICGDCFLGRNGSEPPAEL
jgi:hypothetical protein